MPFPFFSYRSKRPLGPVQCAIKLSHSWRFRLTGRFCLSLVHFPTDWLRYVDDILRSTPRSVEQVTIEPDGTWSQITQKETPGRTNGTQSSDDGDDDLVEIHNIPRLNAVKDESFPTPTSMAGTPPYSSREQSLGSGAPRPNSNKRPIAQVIDLTFSSDDEEGQPHQIAKRQHTQLASNDLTSAYNPTGTPIVTSIPRPGGKSFSLPKLAPARPPQSVDYRNGNGHF